MLYLLPALYLLACAQPVDLTGTWMFTRTLTPETGEECAAEEPEHNLDGAYAPGGADDPGDTGDTGTAEDPWTGEEVQEDSPEVFFGRLEEDATGMLLVIGSAVYPGTATDEEGGGWSFSWTRSSRSYSEGAHVSGYLYTASEDASLTVSVIGTFTEGTFTGVHATETTSTASWTESDTWSDEVAATLGTTGALPAASYLVRRDGSGVESPAINDYATFDCADSDCYLDVSSACAYSYDLTGVWTGFTPEDARWVQDAGQPSGAP